mgnify:CR=1 FL=1
MQAAHWRGRQWRVRARRGVLDGVIMACVLGAPTPALATNASYLPGYGSKSLGLGGGGAALPQDALTIVTNVAGLAQVPDGVDLGVTLYSPWTRMNVAGNAQTTDLHWFPAPSFGIKGTLRPDLAWGFSIYGNGGIGNDYEPSPFDRAAGGGKPTGIDHTDRLSLRMVSLLAVPSLAWQATPDHAFGAGLLLSYQSFNAKGLGLFGCFTPEGAKDAACQGGAPVPSREPDGLTNNGNAYQFGAGLRVGWLWHAHPRLSVGVGGSTRIKNTRLHKYDRLLPDKGSLDLPPQANIGFAFKATDRLTLLLDYQKTFYEAVAAYSNPGPVLGQAPRREQLLGTDRGFGFGWRDQNMYKLGMHYRWRDDWVLRAGMNHSPSPIARSQLSFALLNPAIMETTVHVGFTKTLRNGDEITMAAFHGFEERLKGQSLLGPAYVEHYEYGLDFSYHWR